MSHILKVKHLKEFELYWLVLALHLGKSACILNPLSAKFIKWSNALKKIVGNQTNLPICLSVFDHFSGLAFKGLSFNLVITPEICYIALN